MPEELEAQNTSEQTEEPAQPEGGQEESTQEVEETQPIEDKKQRDFEQGMYKWRQKAKELETELSTFKSQPQQTSLPEETDEQQKAMELLGNIFEEKLAPLRSELEAGKREAAIERIGKLPYTADYADEIADEVKSLPKEWAFEKKLEMARASVIAKNLDTIVRTTKESGLNEAYEHQAVKGVKPLGAAPAKSATDKSLLERFEAQELTPKEMSDNWAEIDKLRKEQFGV
jgi:hypothetical protein